MRKWKFSMKCEPSKKYNFEMGVDTNEKKNELIVLT